tara:strand:+ start:102 stop:446 length:345 start_codon:yes stop_codon:yes gene_type:complete
MRITREKIVRLICETLGVSSQFPDIKYVGYDVHWDQVEWIFNINGNEISLPPSTETRPDDVAWSLESSISPPGVDNDALAYHIEDILKNDQRFLADSESAMSDMLSYMDNEYSY